VALLLRGHLRRKERRPQPLGVVALLDRVAALQHALHALVGCARVHARPRRCCRKRAAIAERHEGAREEGSQLRPLAERAPRELAHRHLRRELRLGIDGPLDGARVPHTCELVAERVADDAWAGGHLGLGLSQLGLLVGGDVGRNPKLQASGAKAPAAPSSGGEARGRQGGASGSDRTTGRKARERGVTRPRTGGASPSTPRGARARSMRRGAAGGST
jgi:hypothetical protein